MWATLALIACPPMANAPPTLMSVVTYKACRVRSFSPVSRLGAAVILS